MNDHKAPCKETTNMEWLRGMLQTGNRSKQEKNLKKLYGPKECSRHVTIHNHNERGRRRFEHSIKK